MTARGGSEAGFTLVESLASLAVLALLSLMLVAGVQFARLRLTRLEDAGQGQAVEAAQTALRERLERSYPLAKFFAVQPEIAFDGQGDHLAFVAPAAQAHGPDILQHFGLTVTARGDLRMSMVSDLANDPEVMTYTTLLRGVRGLDLAYFGAAAPDHSPRWRDRWSQQPTLPQLVRIRLNFPPGDPRVWPDLVVHPVATLDSLCVIDPATNSCRGRT